MTSDLSVTRAPRNVKTLAPEKVGALPLSPPSLPPLRAYRANGRWVEELPCLLLAQGSARINTSRECVKTKYYDAGLQNVNIFSCRLKENPRHNTGYLACGREATYMSHAKQSGPSASP